MTKKSSPNHDAYNGRDIATMAVYRQGGALRFVHLEDVAMKAAELSPRRFRWSKYPEQINLESVRLALKNELKLNGGRIAGGISDGWMLTPTGMAWCASRDKGSEKAGPLVRLHGELERARNTVAFNKVRAGQLRDVSPADLQGLLRIDHYTTPRGLKERALALANAAVLDNELQSVLTALIDNGFDQLEVQE